MDFYSTLMTGLQWGLILDACWIIPYLGLLFYHFYKMENDPAYAMRYDQSERMIKRVGAKEAVIENSKIRIVTMRFRILVNEIKKIPHNLLDLIIQKKKGVRKR
jgi:hypothetical protein